MATLLKKKQDTNVSEMERWISLVAGAGLVAYGVSRRGPSGLGWAAIGGGLAWRGASGHCNVYQTFGIDTRERGYEKGTGADKGVPYHLGIRIDHEIRINKSAEELYRFWRNLENLPRFMSHIDSVQDRGNGVSHWTVRGPAGLKLEWDAEIVNEIENKLIGWRSLPGSQVDNGGSVHFEPAGEGQTVVRVELQYNPPAGGVGARISKALGEDPEKMIAEDLQRFRELMETGAVASRNSKQRASGTESRWTGGKPKKNEGDNVQASGEESFPASDPPSWTPETL
ncbi:MAG: SRPBCC family protein [Bryobacteraceae bacterium]|nr:SRPBCC family protein [Bryobacteraceae bacterium]